MMILFLVLVMRLLLNLFSHTSQQNRYLLEVACIMIIHMRFPTYLWSDPVLSACHLINQTSDIILILYGKTHFSCFFPNKSLLPFHRMYLVGPVMVKTLFLGLDKLSPYS